MPGVTISSSHSIARVKRALAHATRAKRSRRSATLYIACLRWLGRWGF